jgi:hypothetical protein
VPQVIKWQAIVKWPLWSKIAGNLSASTGTIRFSRKTAQLSWVDIAFLPALDTRARSSYNILVSG